MKMIEISALPNGAHRNQTFSGTLPDGWAVVPETMEPLENFPFGEVTAGEVAHYRENVVEQEVTKTRDTGMVGEDGNPITEEYTELEMVAVQESYGVMTITGWTPGTMPEPESDPADTTPTEKDDTAAMLIDHEYRLTLLELGISEY